MQSSLNHFSTTRSTLSPLRTALNSAPIPDEEQVDVTETDFTTLRKEPGTDLGKTSGSELARSTQQLSIWRWSTSRTTATTAFTSMGERDRFGTFFKMKEPLNCSRKALLSTLALITSAMRHVFAKKKIAQSDSTAAIKTGFKKIHKYGKINLTISVAMNSSWSSQSRQSQSHEELWAFLLIVQHPVRGCCSSDHSNVRRSSWTKTP